MPALTHGQSVELPLHHNSLVSSINFSVKTARVQRLKEARNTYADGATREVIFLSVIVDTLCYVNEHATPLSTRIHPMGSIYLHLRTGAWRQNMISPSLVQNTRRL